MKCEWRNSLLGDFVQIKGGKRLPKGIGLQTIPNGHPYIRIRDMGKCKILNLNSDYEYVDDITQKSISRYIVNEGDIVISIVGTIGLVGIVGSSLNDANLTENCVRLINSGKLDRDYLYYYLISDVGQSEIRRGIVGAVQPKLPIKNIQEINIRFPVEVHLQTKIAKVLSALDDKIELNNQINKNLEEQAQALYKSWFVDFEPFGRRRPTSWYMGILSDLANISTGKRPTIKSDIKTSEFCIPIVGASSVMGYTSKSNYNDKILITGRVGTHGVIQRFSTACWASDNTLVITSNYYEYVNQILGKIDYSSLNRGSTQPLITQGDMNKKPVLIPDTETLNRFETIVGALMTSYDYNNNENMRLEEVRDSLLPKLMSGEIDVDNVEI